MKNLFAELKKTLEKDDEDVVFPGASATVQQAKAAEAGGELVSTLFRAWAESKDVAADSRRVGKTQFVAFCRSVLGKDINDTSAQDLYMSVMGRLKALLQQIQTPSQSFQDSMDFPQNADLGSTGFDMNILSDPARRAALMSQYGMSTT
jgi:hypothetical protein